MTSFKYYIFIHFPIRLSITINFIYSATISYKTTISDINENFLSKIGKVIEFCNGIIYYGTHCISS